jgi:hypothetical protein
MRWLAFAGGLVLVLSAPAVAQERPTVAVEVDACVPVDAAELHRVAAIELGHEVDYRAGVVAEGSVTQVRVSCAEAGIELAVADALTHKSMTRTLALGEMPERSRTRLLALAVAEFVAASWVELSLVPQPAVAPTGPPAGDDARAAAQAVTSRRAPPPPKQEPPPPAPPPPKPHPWLLAGAFSVQRWSSDESVLFGGAARLLHAAPGHVAWTVAFDAMTTSKDVSTGSVSATTFAASGGLLLHLRAASVGLYAGPGLRAGLVRLAGEPDGSEAQGGRSFAPLLGLVWLSRAEFEVTPRLRFGFDLELGIATMTARALHGEDTALELSGGWITGALGVGVAL